MVCDVSVIIPQFGQVELTMQCVESLLEFHKGLHSLQIVIVDDGTTRSELSRLQEKSYSNTVLIRNKQNQGVTYSWNRGAEFASASNLIFLNNDTISRGSWCQAIAEVTQKNPFKIVGPELRVEPLIPTCLQPVIPENKLISGWCFGVSRSFFQHLGGFDTNFRLYYSDTDFQLRAAELPNPGDSLQQISNLPISHAAHQTTRHVSARSQQWILDRQKFLRKWRTFFQNAFIDEI